MVKGETGGGGRGIRTRHGSFRKQATLETARDVWTFFFSDDFLTTARLFQFGDARRHSPSAAGRHYRGLDSLLTTFITSAASGDPSGAAGLVCRAIARLRGRNSDRVVSAVARRRAQRAFTRLPRETAIPDGHCQQRPGARGLPTPTGGQSFLPSSLGGRPHRDRTVRDLC